jgi:3-methyladenine DNA glycosylase AlkC
MSESKISRASDIPELLRDAVADLQRALPRIRKLAASSDWKEREVAATILVEASRKNPEEVLEAMDAWAGDADANVRRAASESLRGLARRDPTKILRILDRLNDDESLYVRKSVASMLRNASRKHADVVLQVARRWSREASPRTSWIVREGLKKLRASHPNEVSRLLATRETA